MWIALCVATGLFTVVNVFILEPESPFLLTSFSMQAISGICAGAMGFRYNPESKPAEAAVVAVSVIEILAGLMGLAFVMLTLAALVLAQAIRPDL